MLSFFAIFYKKSISFEFERNISLNFYSKFKNQEQFKIKITKEFIKFNIKKVLKCI